MSKLATLGGKHTCKFCNGKFYDLKKDPIICPVCEQIHIHVEKQYFTPRKRRVASTTSA